MGHKWFLHSSIFFMSSDGMSLFFFLYSFRTSYNMLQFSFLFHFLIVFMFIYLLEFLFIFVYNDSSGCHVCSSHTEYLRIHSLSTQSCHVGFVFCSQRCFVLKFFFKGRWCSSYCKHKYEEKMLYGIIR